MNNCTVCTLQYVLRLRIRSQCYVRIIEAYPRQIFRCPYIQDSRKDNGAISLCSEVDPEYLHSCLQWKQTARSLQTLFPIFQKPKCFQALLAPFGFFTKTLPSMLVTVKNEAGNSMWMYVKFLINLDKWLQLGILGGRKYRIFGGRNHVRIFEIMKSFGKYSKSEYPSWP